MNFIIFWISDWISGPLIGQLHDPYCMTHALLQIMISRIEDGSVTETLIRLFHSLCRIESEIWNERPTFECDMQGGLIT